MGKSKGPTPPSPQATAAAQSASNVETAKANATLGYVNQRGPDGSLTYNKIGEENGVPRYEAVTTLSPNQYLIKRQNDWMSLQAATTAAEQSSRLRGHLQTPFAFSTPSISMPNMQQIGRQAGPITRDIADAGSITNNIANAGPITRTYGADDFSADRQRVEDALMARMQGRLDLDQENLQSRLANQGIRIGSDAYTRAQADFGQNINDARMSAILAGGQEQSRMTNLEAQQAGFENAAQAQAYQQNANDANFQNAAQSQRFGQNASRANFGNAAQAQAYQQGIGSAQQDFSNEMGLQSFMDQRRLAERNQPLNEIGAVMSGGQVSTPNFQMASAPQMPGTDMAGLINANYQQQAANYQQQQQQRQGLMGGLFGLGASAIMASDKRVKKGVKKVGSLDGHDLYRYRYKGKFDDGQQHVGVMAQDVEKKQPDAVLTGSDGVKRVNYGSLFGVGVAA